MSSLSAGLITATTLQITGAQAGSIKATNLDFNNLHVSDILSLDASGDILTVKIKDQSITLTTGMMGDLFETTQSGRIALAKALNFGIKKSTYDAMHYTELLEAGYSGKGISIGQLEGFIDFRDPMFRHILNPRTVFPTGVSNAQEYQIMASSQNGKNFWGFHTPAVLANMAAFDLHATIAFLDGTQTEQTYIAPAYNADITCLAYADPSYSVDMTLMDEAVVELIEKAWAQDVKVIACANLVFENFSYYEYMPTDIENNGNANDGISNTISYMMSLCADHDTVMCIAGGNNEITFATPSQNLGENGHIPYGPDARNVLAVGAASPEYLIDGSGYPYSPIKYYKQVDESGNVTYTISEPDGEYTRQVLPYSCYGTTQDGRIKPDILCYYEYESTAEYTPGPGGDLNFETFEWSYKYGPDKWVYTISPEPFTSFAAPKVAGGVALLREALPNLDAHQIRECIMLSTGSEPTGNGAGYGTLNLAAALAYGQSRPNTMPPSFEAGEWFPKSVQSDKFVADPSGNEEYQAAYADYEAVYADYVASAESLWSGAVLDESPEPGLFGSSGRAMNIDGSFDVKKAKSWICCAEADMEELKNLMTTNGIKVGYTSKSLGAFSVTADSVDQLKAVVNGNTLIRDVKPCQKLKVDTRIHIKEDHE